VGAAGAGSASFFIPLALPPDPTLAGLEFSCQALVDESPGVFSTTAGLTVRLVMPPVIFVGTSVGGSADPTYFIDPITQSMRAPFTSNADNVTDAEFAHDGRRLYVGLSLGNSVQEVNLDTPIPTWSTFFAASGSCYGISVDHQRDIVYTLAGQSPGNELVAIDAALGSPTYGQVIGTTTGLGATNGFVERWELSPDGRTAAVLTVFSPQLILVDTDPSSPTYLQFNNLGPIPAGTSPFPLATTVIFTADSAQILVAISLGQAGEIGRYDLAFGQWLDHDPGTPGIQQIGPSSAPPATVPAGTWDLDLSPNGLFAVVAGFGGAGGAGRLQLDPTNALNWGYTPLATGIPGAWACAVSGDNQSVAVGSFGGPSPQLVVLDALTGATQFTVPLPGASNVYTVKWH
jgi:hypothetical protein